MPMMLALTLMLMLDAVDVAAYAATDANADAKMPNASRHLSCWCLFCVAATTVVADANAI